MALDKTNPDPRILAEIERYRAAYERDPSSRAFAALSDAYRRAGMLNEAIQVATSGVKLHPRYIGGMVALGRAFLAGERLDEAHAEFEKVIAINQR